MGQDYKPVCHALKFLAPGGILVAITAPNWKPEQLNTLRNHGVLTVKQIPAGTCKAAGTSIATTLLVLKT